MPGPMHTAELRAELAAARRRVADLEAALGSEANPAAAEPEAKPSSVDTLPAALSSTPGRAPSGSMSVDEVMRYGRQVRYLPVLTRHELADCNKTY